MQVYGFLEKAQMENVSADLSNTLLGLFWFNTTDSKMRIYDGAVRSMVTEDGAATLTNKIFSGGTITGADISGGTLSGIDINLGAATDANKLVVSKETRANLEALTREEGSVYYSSDEQKYLGDDGLNLVEFGSGSGGGINYVDNPDAESNADGHIAYKDSASEVPDDGTGGAPTLAVARSTVDPLVGKASFVITKPASNVQGEGIKIANEDFDDADKGKIQVMSFEYNADDANYSDGDFRVYFKDETNSVIYRVNGEDVKAGKGTHYARVQVPIDCDNGSLIIHCAATNALGYDFKYDRVSFGPQKLAYGTIVEDGKGYTPNLNSLVNVSVREATYYRVGDSINIQGRIVYSGVGDASQIFIELPSGLVADTEKLKSNTGGISTNIGSGTWLDAGSRWNVLTAMINQTSDKIYLAEEDGANLLLSSLMGSGDEVSFNVTIPIAGWSSQAITSEDFGGRDVVLEAHSNNAESITSNTTNIPYKTIVTDTAAIYDGTTITVPETGYYDIDFSRRFTAAVPGSFIVYNNGAAILRKEIPASNIIHEGTFASVYFEKGDLVTFRSEGSGTLFNDSNHHRLRFAKRSSSQQILETEIVAARYTSSNGQVVPANTVIEYEELDYDTHNAYDILTGRYTVPVSGKYDVRALMAPASATAYRYMGIKVNGVFTTTYYLDTVGITENGHIRVSDLLDLVKGDYVEIFGRDISYTLATDSAQNTFSIARIK